MSDPYPPHRLAELAKDLDEAAAVAEVHAGVRLALAAGRALLAALAEAQRERDELRADVESLGHWHCPNCGGGEATDVDDDGAMCATCGHQIEWSEPDVLSRAKAYAAKLRDAKNRAFKERDAARADAERMRPVVEAARALAAERTFRRNLLLRHYHEERALAAAVDTYETQTGGTE